MLLIRQSSQLQHISRDVTECDRELAVAQSLVALEACFHNKQCKAWPFGIVYQKIVALLHYDTRSKLWYLKGNQFTFYHCNIVAKMHLTTLVPFNRAHLATWVLIPSVGLQGLVVATQCVGLPLFVLQLLSFNAEVCSSLLTVSSSWTNSTCTRCIVVVVMQQL